MLILKTTMSLQVLTGNEMLSIKILVINDVGHVEASDRSKRVKPKIGRSESQKSAKSQKLSKSGKSKGEKSKKLSKSGNSPNFNTTEARPSFLTPDPRTYFNRLWLAFTKAPIF